MGSNVVTQEMAEVPAISILACWGHVEEAVNTGVMRILQSHDLRFWQFSYPSSGSSSVDETFHIHHARLVYFFCFFFNRYLLVGTEMAPILQVLHSFGMSMLTTCLQSMCACDNAHKKCIAHALHVSLTAKYTSTVIACQSTWQPLSLTQHVAWDWSWQVTPLIKVLFIAIAHSQTWLFQTRITRIIPYMYRTIFERDDALLSMRWKKLWHRTKIGGTLRTLGSMKYSKKLAFPHKNLAFPHGRRLSCMHLLEWTVWLGGHRVEWVETSTCHHALSPMIPCRRPILHGHWGRYSLLRDSLLSLLMRWLPWNRRTCCFPQSWR